MVGEERHKALLVLVFNVYFTGSELSALPVTPSEGPSQGVWMSAEAYRVVARSLRRYSWSLNAFGVFWQCTPQTMTQPITRGNEVEQAEELSFNTILQSGHCAVSESRRAGAGTWRPKIDRPAHELETQPRISQNDHWAVRYQYSLN
jgi:hypothetical protein